MEQSHGSQVDTGKGLVLSLDDLVSLIAFSAGLVLIITRFYTGLILFGVAAAHTITKHLLSAKTVSVKRSASTTYPLWLIDKMRQTCELYNLRDVPDDQFSLDSRITASPDSELALTISEYALVNLISSGAHITLAAVVAQGTRDTGITRLRLDDVDYVPSRLLSRLLLSLADDARFKDLPIRSWLTQGRAYLFTPAPEQGNKSSEVEI